MACFAPPYGSAKQAIPLTAQMHKNNRLALIPDGGKLVPRLIA
jgi:hypothetical protein